MGAMPEYVNKMFASMAAVVVGGKQKPQPARAENAAENAINTAVDQLWEALEMALEKGGIQETDVFELSGDLYIHGAAVGRRLANKCKEHLEERYEDFEEPLCPECHAGIMQPTHVFRETHGEWVATRMTCDNENCQHEKAI